MKYPLFDISFNRNYVKLFLFLLLNSKLDFEFMLRTAKEFNFTITAFHHATEAWRIPELLQQNGITVALFADSWGYKLEAYDSTVYAPVILTKNGVKVALKSDHPIYFANYLIYDAARAYHYGLSEQDALAAITRIPAEVMGLGDRIGTVEVGKDGDLVM